MKKREPFELKKFMVAYNFCQVIASFYNSFEVNKITRELLNFFKSLNLDNSSCFSIQV